MHARVDFVGVVEIRESEIPGEFRNSRVVERYHVLLFRGKIS